MNKLLYISVIIIGLVLVSCSKQEIVPNPTNTKEIPTWSNERSSFSDDDDSNVGDPTIDDGSDDGSDDGGITDPNNDPDGNSTKDD